MPSDLFLAAVIRWVALSAMAVVIGGLAIELVVLPSFAPEAAEARRRLRRIGVVALAVLTLASVGELVVRTVEMAGGGSSAALRAIPAVLGGTHFGIIWIARLVALTLALALG